MTVPESMKARVRQHFNNRCSYCLTVQQYYMALLEVEHIIPRVKNGADEDDNLCLSCRLCNGFKATQTEAVDPETGKTVPLFHPRQQQWTQHFAWDETGTRITGLTECGRATVEALKLNNPIAVMVRENWVKAGWHPPVI